MERPINVLIVDDNKTLTDLAGRCLSIFADIHVAGIANTGLEAIHILREKAVDVVLLDIVMPGMDGYEVLRQINQMEANKPLVIVISAVGSDRFVQKALELGAKCYLEKPLRVETVAAQIRALCAADRGCRILG